jgi:hypothetical protein
MLMEELVNSRDGDNNLTRPSGSQRAYDVEIKGETVEVSIIIEAL